MKTLYPVTYHPFTSNEIKPSGWLKRQLRIQAEGRQKRAEAEKNLAAMEENLKQKLLDM